MAGLWIDQEPPPSAGHDDKGKGKAAAKPAAKKGGGGAVAEVHDLPPLRKMLSIVADDGFLPGEDKENADGSSGGGAAFTTPPFGVELMQPAEPTALDGGAPVYPMRGILPMQHAQMFCMHPTAALTNRLSQLWVLSLVETTSRSEPPAAETDPAPTKPAAPAAGGGPRQSVAAPKSSESARGSIAGDVAEPGTQEELGRLYVDLSALLRAAPPASKPPGSLGAEGGDGGSRPQSRTGAFHMGRMLCVRGLRADAEFIPNPNLVRSRRRRVAKGRAERAVIAAASAILNLAAILAEPKGSTERATEEERSHVDSPRDAAQEEASPATGRRKSRPPTAASKEKKPEPPPK